MTHAAHNSQMYQVESTSDLHAAYGTTQPYSRNNTSHRTSVQTFIMHSDAQLHVIVMVTCVHAHPLYSCIVEHKIMQPAPAMIMRYCISQGEKA